MVSWIKSLAKRFCYELIKTTKAPGSEWDQDADFERLYEACHPYTMTSKARMQGLYRAVRYVVARDIPGDFVECGVWQGGSTMLAAMTLHLLGDAQRKLYLYDTFEGMTPPGEKDVDYRGNLAQDLLAQSERADVQSNIWACVSIETVMSNLKKTGLKEDRFVLVKGPVEETIPRTVPEQISLLRLDTDWYESTYHELQHLYPLLSTGGVLIIDDYGHWQGAREATDRYFAEAGAILLHPLDYTGRIAVKV